MTDEAQPISYRGVSLGTPVLSSTGQQFGTLEQVLEIPSADLFDGVVVATDRGPRFVDRDQIAEITCPTRYFEEASSINLQRSITYGLGVLRVSIVHRLCKWRLMKRKMYEPLTVSNN